MSAVKLLIREAAIGAGLGVVGKCPYDGLIVQYMRKLSSSFVLLFLHLVNAYGKIPLYICNATLHISLLLEDEELDIVQRVFDGVVGFISSRKELV